MGIPTIVSNRLVNEVREIDRIAYSANSKPPAAHSMKNFQKDRLSHIDTIRVTQIQLAERYLEVCKLNKR